METSIDRGLDRLRHRRARLVLAFSADEPLHAELEQGGVLAWLDELPNVGREHLPARDHTLRPIIAQRAVHELLDRHLASEMVAAGYGGGALGLTLRDQLGLEGPSGGPADST